MKHNLAVCTHWSFYPYNVESKIIFLLVILLLLLIILLLLLIILLLLLIILSNIIFDNAHSEVTKLAWAIV